MGQSQSNESRSFDEEQQGSGVTLAPELEADIVRDFQSKVLQEEWNKFGQGIINRRNERLQMIQQKVNENQQQRHVQAVARQQRMQSIDAAIDSMNAKFTDDTVALEYDTEQLMKKYGNLATKHVDDPDKESKPLPCLGQRAHWIDCQKKYTPDSRPCNFYVQALEECVRKTIGGGEEQQQGY